jgi:DNA-binding transcriptional LysR family regulator
MESVDLGLLVSLDALLQEGSVTGAARRVGLSTPAMSHALARARERLGDPILVRSGRGMLLTPRALALRARVHDVVTEARRALEPERPFVAHELSQTFVVHATDYVLDVIGLAVDRILRAEAPKVCVRFVPNTPDDPSMLRDHGSDLAVGIYGELPQEMRSQRLLTDRFVCRRPARDIPALQASGSHSSSSSASHTCRWRRAESPADISTTCSASGASRAPSRAPCPYFVTALQLVAQTDYVLTISERIAKRFADSVSRAQSCSRLPIKLRPYALSLVWHPRVDADAGAPVPPRRVPARSPRRRPPSATKSRARASTRRTRHRGRRGSVVEARSVVAPDATMSSVVFRCPHWRWAR